MVWDRMDCTIPESDNTEYKWQNLSSLLRRLLTPSTFNSSGVFRQTLHGRGHGFVHTPPC